MPPGRLPSRFQPLQLVGDWKLLKRQPSSERKGQPRLKASWFCQCSCGITRWIQEDNLASGSSRSCGHESKGRHTHLRRLNIRAVNSVFNLAEGLPSRRSQVFKKEVDTC